MTRLSVLAVAALALVASPALLVGTTGPAAAQEDDWTIGDTDVGGGNLRDLVQGWLDERSDRRDMLMDMLQERRDRRDELMDMLRERRDRRADMRDFLQNHPELRERLRERIASRWNDEDDGGGPRARLRQRLAGRSGGECYFLTRSLRAQDGSLLVVVRRRVCPD